MKVMVLSLGILVFGSAEMLYMYVNFFYQCLLWSPFHWSIWLSLLEIRHSYLVKFMEILLPMSHGIKVRRKQIINTCICDCRMFYCCCMSHSEHFTSFITACNLWHLAGRLLVQCSQWLPLILEHWPTCISIIHCLNTFACNPLTHC